MYLEFCGAANGVTGSLHRIHINGVDVGLDCGLYQGHRQECRQLNRSIPQWATQAEAFVLSHAHIDHSGNLPTLVRRGFQNNIFTTPPTRDLCSAMLRDSAMIQSQDAKYLHRKFGENIEPLYSVDDAQQATSQMISIPLYRPFTIAPGVSLTFHNAGHVLGSALVQLDLHERGRRLRFLFTGDLGRDALPLLAPPDIVNDVDFLLTESTYGDRVHPPPEENKRVLAKAIRDTVARGGKVLIPTFALERAQEVLYTIRELSDENLIPSVPVYIDSPLAIAITEIYKLHPEALSESLRAKLSGRQHPFAPPGLDYVSSMDESMSIQSSDKPAIIIAGSGMCEGGRILYHLRKGVEDPKNTIVIVGFMAQHTLGRRIVERRPEVKVLGLMHALRADVKLLNGLSAHADADDLVNYAVSTAKLGSVRRIGIVHGEDDAKSALADRLGERGGYSIIQSEPGKRVEL